MGKFKGRNTVACTACHTQKVKCTGGSPCRRCALRNRECVYPKKDKFIAVPESYLREVEGEANLRHSSSAAAGSSADEVSNFSSSDHQPTIEYSQTNESRPARTHLQEDSSAERFIQKLKELSTSLHPFTQPSSAQSPSSASQGGYTYLRLKSDFQHPQISIRLPPKPYALRLLEIFEEIFCDYHWFLRRDFRERLCLTYSHPADQSSDRKWLCRVSVVLALAQTFVYSDDALSPPMRQSGGDSALIPPGSDLFEQAILLFHKSSEEPVAEDIEALNLMAFYCYSLNRRKTAFTYASQSVTLAKLMHLDKPQHDPSRQFSSRNDNPQRVIDEHLRRLWWTSYCMDRMVAAELGLTPTHFQPSIHDGVPLPSSNDLLPEDYDQFFDPYMFSAQIQLGEIKRKVADTVGGLVRTARREEILDAISPCLVLLQEWKEGLPPHMASDFDDGSSLFNLPWPRGLASLYLRYHQCFTVFMRPFYFHDLSLLMSDRVPDTQSTNLGEDFSDCVQAMKMDCLHAAQNNCKILLDLARHGKIAKFGYWDAIHTFSALVILSLSKLPVADTEQVEDDDDSSVYLETRAILEDMARVGNLAAKDHEATLQEVEAMVKEVSARASQLDLTATGADVQSWELQTGTGDSVCYDLLGDQLWWDMVWSSFSDTYAEGL